MTRFKQYTALDPQFVAKKLQEFFKSLGLPVTLKDLDISDDKFDKMADKTMLFGSIGNYTELQREDVVNIYKLAG